MNFRVHQLYYLETFLETEPLLHHILAITEEFQALEPTVLKVSDFCDFADYFVIVTGTSIRHVQSLAEELNYKCKHAGELAHSVEGKLAGEWCLLDFGSVVVHVFTAEKRAQYNLEELWGAGRVNATAIVADDED